MASLQFGPVTTVKLWTPKETLFEVEPIEVLAEINTAYSQTFVQEGIGTSLGLAPVGTVKITTATKALYEVYQYLIRIAFPAADQAFEVTVAEVPYILRPKANGRIRCLIGRDILQYGVLTYDGPANEFTLAFKGVSNAGRADDHTA